MQERFARAGDDSSAAVTALAEAKQQLQAAHAAATSKEAEDSQVCSRTACSFSSTLSMPKLLLFCSAAKACMAAGRQHVLQNISLC